MAAVDRTLDAPRLRRTSTYTTDEGGGWTETCTWIAPDRLTCDHALAGQFISIGDMTYVPAVERPNSYYEVDDFPPASSMGAARIELIASAPVKAFVNGSYALSVVGADPSTHNLPSTAVVLVEIGPNGVELMSVEYEYMGTTNFESHRFEYDGLEDVVIEAPPRSSIV